MHSSFRRTTNIADLPETAAVQQKQWSLLILEFHTQRPGSYTWDRKHRRRVLCNVQSLRNCLARLIITWPYISQLLSAPLGSWLRLTEEGVPVLTHTLLTQCQIDTISSKMYLHSDVRIELYLGPFETTFLRGTVHTPAWHFQFVCLLVFLFHFFFFFLFCFFAVEPKQTATYAGYAGDRI